MIIQNGLLLICELKSSTKKVKNAKRKESRKRAQLLGEVLKLVQGNRDIVKVEYDDIKDVIKEYTSSLIQEPLSSSSTSQHGPTTPTSLEELSDDIDDDCVYAKISPYAEISEELKAKIIAQSDATGKFISQ